MTLRPLVFAALTGCIYAPDVLETLADADAVLVSARAVHACVCAPEELANAEADLAFARLELFQGELHRASEHAYDASGWSAEALERATPCGTADRDADGIIDLSDLCPDEAEDKDGIDDEDGCREVAPTGDEDLDTVMNIDDACVWEPEDKDGDADTDGCPETSADTDGDALIDAVDLCFDMAEDRDSFNDEDGCPDSDNDKDGLPDIVDVCTNIPEDPDGWDDHDGCPEPDNDADGLADVDDQCPNEEGPREKFGCPSDDADGDGIGDANDKCPETAETPNSYLDEDGCPDTPPTRVSVSRQQIKITETVQFEVGKATLLAASYPLLDDVAKVMRDAPEMRVRVEGHTDSDGSESGNLDLSQKRAESVRDYFVRQGIAADRLTAVGFGETRPIDTNRTASGKAANRRVEFHIVNP